MESIKNAYMLVYERKQKSTIKRVITKADVESLQSGKGNENPVIECEESALSRAAPGKICHVAKNDELITYVDYYDYNSSFSMNYYEEVFENNSQFLFERQIYSKEFFKFVQEILTESYELLPSLQIQDKSVLEVCMCQVATKIIFDVLAHAYSNELLKPLSEKLSHLLSENEMAADSFFDYILEGNMSKAKLILHKCTDKKVRNIISNLISEVVIKMLPKQGNKYTEYEVVTVDNVQTFKYKTRIGSLLNYFIKGIDNDLSRNWPRFEQYFTILLKIVKSGGESMVIYMKQRKLLKTLASFYLGELSPLDNKGEKQITMGNKFVSPKFKPLIELISYLASFSDLTIAQPLFKKITHKFPKSLYELSEEEKQYLIKKEFIQQTIIEGCATQTFAELMGILCYESEKFSRQLAKFLLNGIIQAESKKIIPCITVLKCILGISDSLQKKRFEWLLGVCTLRQKSIEKPIDLMHFGLGIMDNISDSAYEYPSTLLNSVSNNSLLNLLLISRKRYDIYPIRGILELMLQNEAAFDYITNLPPPSYEFAKYVDWIKPCLDNFPSGVTTFYGYTYATRKEKENNAIKETNKLLENFMAKLQEKIPPNPNNPTIFQACCPGYLIGKTINDKLKGIESKDGISLAITEVTTEVFNSLPNGKENLMIPSAYFEKPKVESFGKFIKLMKLGAAGTGEQKIEVAKQPEVKKIEVTPLRTETTILKFGIINRIFDLSSKNSK